MSTELGPLTFGRKEEMIFLGKEIAHEKDYSEATAQKIDREVRALVETSHQRALQLIKNNEDKLHALAQALLEREILDAQEIDKLIAGEPLDAEPAAPAEEPEKPEEKETKAAREEPETGKKGGLQPPPEPHPGPA
jgi:cell division protease FtsH